MRCRCGGKMHTLDWEWDKQMGHQVRSQLSLTEPGYMHQKCEACGNTIKRKNRVPKPKSNIMPVYVAAFGELCDITCKSPDVGFEISIASEGSRIWINDTHGKCIVRICGIGGEITIEDRRIKNEKTKTKSKTQHPTV